MDAATLTGAIVVALGHVNVGLFANDDGCATRVLEAASAAGEKMWPMPLDDEYKEYLKSAFADIPNVGGRWGGAITAAMFLKEFAEDDPVGAPGHRRHRVARRRQAVPGQGPDRRPGAHAGAPGDGLEGLRLLLTRGPAMRSPDSPAIARPRQVSPEAGAARPFQLDRGSGGGATLAWFPLKPTRSAASASVPSLT